MGPEQFRVIHKNRMIDPVYRVIFIDRKVKFLLPVLDPGKHFPVSPLLLLCQKPEIIFLAAGLFIRPGNLLLS